MRPNRTAVAGAVLAGVALLTSAIPASADPIVWTGPSMTFTKPDSADWMLAANQDRLTTNVSLTRGDTLPLFNITAEPFYMAGSPSDTEWAFGPTQPGNPGPISASNHANLVFRPFARSLFNDIGNNAVAYGPGVLHLISEDIYLDVRFTSWTPRYGGGGFSYIRSTPDQSPVPEPATATLLLAGAATGIAARRRKQHTRS